MHPEDLVFGQKIAFEIIQRQNAFHKVSDASSECETNKHKLNIGKRPSKKVEDMISDVKKYLNKSKKEELVLIKFQKHPQAKFQFDSDNYYDDLHNFDDNDEEDNDGHADVFENNEHFHVGEDEWFVLANEDDNSRNNIKRVLQTIRRIL